MKRQFKKLTDEELLIKFDGVKHNSINHPHKDGRNHNAELVKLINEEINHRKKNNTWDEHSAKNGKNYLLYKEENKKLIGRISNCSS